MLLGLLLTGLIAAVLNGQGLQVVVGAGLSFAVMVGCLAIDLAVRYALGGHVYSLRIGIGPRLSRRVSRGAVRELHALPIIVVGRIVPKPSRFRRDWRAHAAILTLGPSILATAVIASRALPTYTAVSLAVLAASLSLTTFAREPSSGRRRIARLFSRATRRNDPTLATKNSPGAIAARASIAVQFGDLDGAQATLDALRADPEAGYESATLAIEILTARGDYTAALGVPIPEPALDDAPALTEARAAANSARIATLLMLSAEKDPSRTPEAAPLVLRHLSAVARAPLAFDVDGTGRALYALHKGAIKEARSENRTCTNGAVTPQQLADALCTSALLHSAEGKPAEAAKSLAEAARFAPWYPRVETVRGLLAPPPQDAIVTAR